jgi:hypothetical protein
MRTKVAATQRKMSLEDFLGLCVERELNAGKPAPKPIPFENKIRHLSDMKQAVLGKLVTFLAGCPMPQARVLENYARAETQVLGLQEKRSKFTG